jgi:hypothetical protein
MSVSTWANFVTAVAAAAPASGNVYQAISINANPNGSNSFQLQQLLKGGTAYANYLNPMVYESKASQFIAATDFETGGFVVRFQAPDGAVKVLDAQTFINTVLV